VKGENQMWKETQRAATAREGRDARPFGERAQKVMKVYGGFLPADVKQLLLDMAAEIDNLRENQP